MSDHHTTTSGADMHELGPTGAVGGEHMVLNFGPQHPATHGTFRLLLELDGERIVRCTPYIGYLHSGFEKLGEHHTYNQYVTVVDRMNYMSPFANDLAYHMAVEKLYGIECTEYTQLVRLMLAEVARLQDHSFFLGTPALDLGSMTPFLWSFVGREECYDVFEFVTGARYMTAYTRTGGLMWDVPPDFKERIKYVADRTPGELDDIESILCSNPIWLSRMQGIGRITAEDVVDYGITGPNARASGVCRDLRRDQPYLGYEAMDFEIPTCAEGDCYARYIVRVEEMRQSARILQQAIRMLPDGGQVNVDPARKVTLPPKAEVHAKMEQMIHHFELIMPGSGGAPPVGEVYVANETAMGELGFYLVSDGTKFPYRVRVRPPSFLHYAMFPRLVEGRLLSDVVSVLSSLNIIAAELDR
ncbi:MAG TPA: NADH dehydrogenase (quinone) subunit D [Phycisphaerae bacterium]|nr:NADH dehydrogenase (quinone) subunit D [Phycisphaerae bacterium]